MNDPVQASASPTRPSRVQREGLADWIGSLLRSVPAAAWVLDHQARIVAANPRAIDEFALAEALKAGPVPLRRLVADSDTAAQLGALLCTPALGQEGTLDDIELRSLLGDPHRAGLRFARIPADPARLPPGSTVTFCVLNDGSAQVDAMQAREARRLAEHQRNLAESASRRTSELLSRVSHELRTPLNAVIGFSRLLMLNQRLAADPDSQHKLGHIRDAGQHLLAMIDEVLQLTRVEAGRLPLKMEAVAAVAVARDVIELHQPLAEPMHLTLSLEVRPAAGLVVVQADARRLRELLINLVSNAVKYNREGGWVHVLIEAAGARVRISVADSGIGMNELQLSHLFEPFNRLGAERLTVAGHGLGLSIARSLAEAMGGSLCATSSPGEGSCFVLELASAVTPT